MTKHLKKIAVAIVTVLTLNFITPTYSHAIDIGGILLKPITALLVAPIDILNAWMTLNIIGISNGFDKIFSGATVDRITEKIGDSDTYKSYEDNGSYTIKSWVATGLLGAKQPLTEADLASWFISMEDFFLGTVDITNINIFQQNSGETSTVKAIKDSVAQWYYALRNLAGVGLLCALIYTAIRILLSSIAEEKAHYKELLMDWIKATCLVVFAHLLMILIINIGETLVSIVSGLGSKYSMLAYIRGTLTKSWDTNQLGYLIVYGILTYYTVCFAISYFKRFLYTLLLIIIAPIVSLMYAFGKQGKDIFRKWLKEFTCNVFLQPYHLLIYTVLFGWVASILEAGQHDLAAVILGLIVAHFIRDAEKYYRGLFGIGQGVAGIGAMDTGDKRIKDVQRRITDVVKSVAQVVAIAVTGGAAAGAMGGAVGASGATASSLGGAAAAAQGAGGTGGAPGGTPGTPPGGAPGGPNPPIGGLPSGGGNNPDDGGVTPPDSGGDGEPDGDFTDVEYDSETGDYIPIEDVNPEGPGAINVNEPLKVEDVDAIKVEDVDDIKVDDSNKNEIVKYESPEAVNGEYEVPDNNGGQVDQLNVGELNANNMSGNDKNSKDDKEFRTKLDKGDLSSEIDKIANALFGGGSRTTVEPGQAPSEARNGGNSLSSLPGTIYRGINATGKIEKDDGLKNLSKGKKGILAANEALNGTSFARRGEDSLNGQTVISEKTERSGNDTVNANVSTNSNVQISSTSGANDGKIEELLKKVEKNGGDKEEIIKAVAKETGKSNDEAKKMYEKAVKNSGQKSSSSDSNYTKVESGEAANSNPKSGGSKPATLVSDSAEKNNPKN